VSGNTLVAKLEVASLAYFYADDFCDINLNYAIPVQCFIGHSLYNNSHYHSFLLFYKQNYFGHSNLTGLSFATDNKRWFFPNYCVLKIWSVNPLFFDCFFVVVLSPKKISIIESYSAS